MNNQSKFVLFEYKLKKYLGHNYEIKRLHLKWDPSYRSSKYSDYLGVYNKENQNTFCFDYREGLRFHCVLKNGKQYKSKKYITNYKEEFIFIYECINKAIDEVNFAFYELRYDKMFNLNVINYMTRSE